MWYFIMILFVIKIFLIILSLYRLYAIDKIEKSFKDKINQLSKRILEIETENAELRTFKYIIENLVTGMRTDNEVRKKIKELLFIK